jgi:pristinamycin I synthase-3/4
MSYAQQRLWFMDQVNGSSTEYNIPEALRLRGELDLRAFQRTMSAIVDRHEILRTDFGLVGRSGLLPHTWGESGRR